MDSICSANKPLSGQTGSNGVYTTNTKNMLFLHYRPPPPTRLCFNILLQQPSDSINSHFISNMAVPDLGGRHCLQGPFSALSLITDHRPGGRTDMAVELQCINDNSNGLSGGGVGLIVLSHSSPPISHSNASPTSNPPGLGATGCLGPHHTFS